MLNNSCLQEEKRYRVLYYNCAVIMSHKLFTVQGPGGLALAWVLCVF